MDPATIGAIGSVLGGVGSILGGAKSSKPDVGAMYAQNYLNLVQHHDVTAQDINLKMALAKQHGIHPLSMLGVPTAGYSPSINIDSGGSSGPDYGSIGRGINQVANAFVKPPEETPDPLAERAAAANVRILEANAKRAEWEALGTEWKVADYAAPALIMGQPGNPPRARMSNDAVEMQRLAAEQAGLSPHLFSGGPAPITMEQNVLPPHPRKLGYGAGTDQAFVTTMDSKGKPGTVLNQNAIQAEFEDGATMTLLTRLYGVDRAIEIMAALEQKGIFGAAALGLLTTGKLLYDRLGKQRNDALQRLEKQRNDALQRRRQFPGRGRGSWKARGGRGGD